MNADWDYVPPEVCSLRCSCRPAAPFSSILVVHGSDTNAIGNIRPIDLRFRCLRPKCQAVAEVEGVVSFEVDVSSVLPCHRLFLLQVLRVYRSSQYWRWMSDRLAVFVSAVIASRPLKDGEIKFVAHIVRESNISTLSIYADVHQCDINAE